jgi:hypothetical protein
MSTIPHNDAFPLASAPADDSGRLYSCRAELAADLFAVVNAARAASPRPLVSLVRSEVTPEGEAYAELRSTMDLATLRWFMRLAEVDSHVMRQTLRPVPLAENSLERDWDVE